MPRERLQVHFEIWREGYVEPVLCLAIFASIAACYFNQVVLILYNAFSLQKACRQFLVMTRRSHGDRQAFSMYADFQGLLNGKCIIFRGLQASVYPLLDRGRQRCAVWIVRHPPMLQQGGEGVNPQAARYEPGIP